MRSVRSGLLFLLVLLAPTTIVIEAKRSGGLGFCAFLCLTTPQRPLRRLNIGARRHWARLTLHMEAVPLCSPLGRRGEATVSNPAAALANALVKKKTPKQCRRRICHDTTNPTAPAPFD